MLHRKRHDIITRAALEANQKHGYTPLQSLIDRANDEVMMHAEARGAEFPYTKTFILVLDRLFSETFMQPAAPRIAAPNPRKKSQWTH